MNIEHRDGSGYLFILWRHARVHTFSKFYFKHQADVGERFKHDQVAPEQDLTWEESSLN